MLYDENDAPALKAWIVKLLESPSRSDGDVDADVLADYVLALLRHEGSRAEVRKLCEEELYDFLKDETIPFVREVFSALDPKEAKPAPAPASKKRAYHESSLPGDDANHRQQQTSGGPAAKQARHGSGSGSGMPGGIPGSGLPYSDNDVALRMQQQMAHMFAPLPGVVGAPAGTTTGGGKGRGGSRRMCRYFEKKGFCSRPDCKFAHGPPTPATDALPVAAMPPAFPGGYGYGYGGMPMPMSSMDPEAMGATGFPFHPMMMFNPAAAAAAYFTPQAQQSVAPRKGGRPRAAISAEGPVRDQSQTKLVVEGIPDEHLDEAAVRTFFQTFGTVKRVALQPARRLAVIEFDSWTSANAAYQSPKAVFDNRFVKVYWHKETGGGGDGNGGEVVFPAQKRERVGGRNKEKKKKKKKKGVVVAASEEDGAEDGGDEDGGDEDGGDEDGDGDADDADDDGADDDDTPAFDMEAFLQKQQIAQALHEEKRRKWEAVERQRQALEVRQKALLAKQQEERQRLIAKMASVAARVKKKQMQQQRQQKEQQQNSDTETPDGSASSHVEGGGDGGGDRGATTTTTSTSASAQTEMIRAQLAALEEEAKLLGLDPDALGHSSSSGGGTWAPRGRGEYYGGRGSSSSFRGGGVRGGLRGGLRGGGSLSSRYAAYSLDNRPRRVAVRGVDLAAPAQNEALRQYLMGVGEYEAIETGDVTVISFADRRTAEKFFYGLRRAATAPTGADAEETWKSIPGVDGAVTVDWVAGNAPAAASGGAAQSKDMATSFVLDIDSEDDDDDQHHHHHHHHHQHEKDGPVDGHETQQQQQQQRAQNVDFDVGDEDWDMQ